MASINQDPAYKASLRLNYRLITEDEEALYHALYTDPEVMRYIGEPWSKERAAATFKEVLALTQEKDFNRRITAIVDRKTGEVLGISSIRLADAERRQAEVGSMLTIEAQSRGFALEYSAALIDHAFKNRPIDELLAQVALGNTAVEKLVMVLGFKAGEEQPGHDGFLPHRTWHLKREAWQLPKLLGPKPPKRKVPKVKKATKAKKAKKVGKLAKAIKKIARKVKKVVKAKRAAKATKARKSAKARKSK